MKADMKARMSLVAIATAAALNATAQAPAGGESGAGPLVTQEVLIQIKEATNPLAEVLQTQGKGLTAAYDRATEILRAGNDPARTGDAIGVVTKAMDGFLAGEGEVNRRLNDGRFVFARLTDNLRMRLAKTLGNMSSPGALRPEGERRLRQIAAELTRERDSQRKTRLTLELHKTYRQEMIYAQAVRLTPAQQRFYLNSLAALQSVESRYNELVAGVEVTYTSLRVQRENLAQIRSFSDDIRQLQDLMKWFSGPDGTGGAWDEIVGSLDGMNGRLAELDTLLADSSQGWVNDLQDALSGQGVTVAREAVKIDAKETAALLERFGPK